MSVLLNPWIHFNLYLHAFLSFFCLLILDLPFILFSFQTTKAFLPRMLELQHGHVVCINSILSQSPIPGVIDYCTSKSSSLAFMESLTLGLLDCPGVGCTTVLPFHTSTEMFQGMRVRYAKLIVLQFCRVCRVLEKNQAAKLKWFTANLSFKSFSIKEIPGLVQSQCLTLHRCCFSTT